MSTPERPRALGGDTFPRRAFLARGAGLAALLAAGNLACSGSDADYARLLGGGARPESLPLREYAILLAVTRAMLPADPAASVSTRPASAPEPAAPPPAGADPLGVARRVDRELAFHPPQLRDDVVSALQVVEYAPLVTRLTRFTRLDPPGQEQVLADLATSRFAAARTAFQGLKFLVMFFYYTQDPTWASIGYDGPWQPRNRPAALA